MRPRCALATRTKIGRALLLAVLGAVLDASTPLLAAGPRSPIPAAAASASAIAIDTAWLDGKSLALPVDGIRAADLHDAIDIAAARGTKVYAVDDGKLVKLFKSVPGGLTLYQFDRDGRVAYYYAHLDRYAEGLREGMLLRRCDLIGYVGSTGNAAADAPHLHFAVFRLGPERQWWKGTPLNPYAALKAAALTNSTGRDGSREGRVPARPGPEEGRVPERSSCR
jgi:peptidoglycan LD-endopeptidase LytH